MAVKVREKVTADGKKFQKMLEDLDKLEVRILSLLAMETAMWQEQMVKSA